MKATVGKDAVHPAWHGSRSADEKVTERLFPREPRRKKVDHEARERAMAAHPAGKGLVRAECGDSYEVQRGDSLWSIASDATDSKSAALIARYWPVVHRANADVIGSDPDVLHPGQVLRLPECDR